MTSLRTWLLAAVLAATALTAPPAAEGAAETPGETAVATFAGGCFWCMEPPYDKLPGVIATTSGYTGGHLADPTYKQVTRGGTGHYEAVQITYDPAKVSYQKLLQVFWRNVDPFDDGGQFCDRGDSYRTAVFFHSDEQEALARESKTEEDARFETTIVTPLIEASEFYPAEGYHQNYYKKNPFRYRLYRRSCGRDNRLKKVWGEEAGG
ncbi:MAG: peptide-methionine (S)-S-oxide reductase MsrA [Gammaproteobacteria bacterium]|nr:peptide-methionine (S)-S-oxide reductase MsrA [Gammaproteobacteria bacterium]